MTVLTAPARLCLEILRPQDGIGRSLSTDDVASATRLRSQDRVSRDRTTAALRELVTAGLATEYVGAPRRWSITAAGVDVLYDVETGPTVAHRDPETERFRMALEAIIVEVGSFGSAQVREIARAALNDPRDQPEDAAA